MPNFLAGIADHFVLRASSWIMSLVLFGVGIVFYQNPGTFVDPPKAYQYVFAYKVFNQETWGTLCIYVGVARLFALCVNGTYKSIPYTNHVRAIGSFLSCFLWLQIALGVWSEGLAKGANTAMPIYLGLIAFDALNTYLATLEIE